MKVWSLRAFTWIECFGDVGIGPIRPFAQQQRHSTGRVAGELHRNDTGAGVTIAVRFEVFGIIEKTQRIGACNIEGRDVVHKPIGIAIWTEFSAGDARQLPQRDGAVVVEKSRISHGSAVSSLRFFGGFVLFQR